MASNKEGYSKRQLHDAKKSSDPLAKGYQSIPDFKCIIQACLILNYPITPIDVYRVAEIYGPDIASLKGKTVKRTPQSERFLYSVTSPYP